MKNKVRYLFSNSAGSAVLDKTIYLKPVAQAAIIIESIDAVGGVPVINITSIFTKTSAIAHKSVLVTLTYQPTGDTGGSVPIAIAAQTILGAGATHSALYMWGIQASLKFLTGSTLASSQVAAARFVLEESGDVSYTSGNIAGMYIDNLITSDLAGISGVSSLMRIANHGGTMDSAIQIYSKKLENLFWIDGVNACFVSAGGANKLHGGTIKHLKCYVDGGTYYLIASDTPTNT